ncbi:MAG TPA: hypothetical protein VGQ51_08685, partial [Puia sp.]|nr:hypothetical protein [Puia sp.]
SNNPNGIFEATLEEDGRPVIGFQLDHISYDYTRNINAHIDYKTKETGGPYLQQLFFLQGYPLPSIYSVPSPTETRGGQVPSPEDAQGGSVASRADASAGHKTSDPAALIAGGLPAPDGVLDIGDGRPHHILIRVRDTEDNQTTSSFDVQYAPASTAAPATPSTEPAPSPAGTKKFYPRMLDGIELPDCAFYLGEHSLYDSAIIGVTQTGDPGSGRKPAESAKSAGTDIESLDGAVSAAYTIGAPWIPLDAPVLVRLRPLSPAADSLRTEHSTDRIVMVRWNKADKDVQRPEWKDGWASARFREFGHFQLVEDTTPPTIDFIGIKDGADLGKTSRIRIDVRDNLGATGHFRAELDGSWLCFTHDKNLAWIYNFDEHCPRGRHTLLISVEDVAGNTTVKELHFIR